MGQPAPFLYFTDHEPALADLVREGRRQEFARFPAFADPEARTHIPDPNDTATFRASIPDPVEAGSAAAAACIARTQRLLALRARSIAPGVPGCRSLGAFALGAAAVRAAWRLGDGAELCILANFGTTAVEVSAPTGGVLSKSAPGTAASVAAGRLPPRTAVAFLAPKPA